MPNDHYVKGDSSLPLRGKKKKGKKKTLAKCEERQIK